ncbi:cytokinin riboside 5'-monophosphate phosphoribohydrolase [Candidatus Phaeomarinobacter ectocarpi]|uniref:Cytokinin riboside 5'-monophosphate phosphoribohydrolase n=1 Tax=Candidatus Phaeomarinibacter ectocarpi TaxID=1458461 RepID=X5MMX1_9HYPH|nr:TIGR00730 family Rossman fold protein [Candidatus Phaeomarinobacter ectocarpi]CDO60770.1 cytokinin riboside 5'-monophosphate phosphoribohydrolase [Candidatus Phaeomarinobacter ectocarpi]
MTNIPRSITVFCGSAAGDNPAFAKAAHDLGVLLANNDIKLVYGGGGIGLMGILARAVDDHGGEVDGIIPEFLTVPEVMEDAPGNLEITENLHDRMQKMAAKADAFVVLPGGIGTIAELVDILTWKQLGRHDKPIIILDIEGYWSPLVELLSHIVAHGFSHGDLSGMFRVVSNVGDLEDVILGIAD